MTITCPHCGSEIHVDPMPIDDNIQCDCGLELFIELIDGEWEITL